MKPTRDHILDRLRRDRPAPLDGEPEPCPATPPASDRGGRIERFRQRLEAVQAEVHLCSADDWTAVLLRLLQEKGLHNLLYGAGGPLDDALRSAWTGRETPQLIHHDGAIDSWKDAIFSTTDAAITSARWGIADTGTLVLWPTAAEPRSLSLVPPVHFAVLHLSDLHQTFAGLMEQQQWQSQMPTNVLLISGPSKTADIEQTLAYGIHGPMELIVLLIH